MNRQQRRQQMRSASRASGGVSSSGSSITGLFQRGLVDHQAGRLQQAHAAFYQLLALDPAHADALHLLGVIALQTGRYDQAIHYIRQAIGLHGVRPNHHSNLGYALRRFRVDHPGLCDAHNNLGNALQAVGRPAEAEASYREALRLRRNYPEAHNNLGNALNALGRSAEAEASCREALRHRPDYPEAYNNLGNALQAVGRPAEAEASYREALRLQPNYPEAYNNLGNVLNALGRPAEAEASYREALRLRPNYPEAHNNLGAALQAVGRPTEAEASYREALRRRPNYPEAHNNLGNALQAGGRPAEAEASYREALRLQPNYPDAHNSLGNALQALGRVAEAEASCREALRHRPDYPEAYNDLGNALNALGRPAEAEASYREALRLRPNFPEVHNNLGIVLNALGRSAEAEASYREALRLRRNYPEAHNNLGNALQAGGRSAEAEASYREALRLQPNYPDAHNNLGYALLSTGQLEEGWKECEWRWKGKLFSRDVRDFSAPLWSGEAIGDRIILLHAEQGLGDTLQFCRYVPLIDRGARIFLEVQAPLVRLLSRLPGITKIAVRGDRLPPCDLHCPLMSLPLAFRTTLDTIPATTPYLCADPALDANWQERLVGLGGLRIGLVWAGSRGLDEPELAARDRRRSVTLKALAPLGEVSGISFISLQKDEPAAEAAYPPHGMSLHDFTADLHDFEDTAALVVNLDLIISVDTSVAHLAGALGKPVWLLNRFDTCWRWLRSRDDSPWYPTVRQFRQPRPGDWDSVIRAARDALQLLVADDRAQLRACKAGI